jgi:hypothetical protein
VALFGGQIKLLEIENAKLKHQVEDLLSAKLTRERVETTERQTDPKCTTATPERPESRLISRHAFRDYRESMAVDAARNGTPIPTTAATIAGDIRRRRLCFETIAVAIAPVEKINMELQRMDRTVGFGFAITDTLIPEGGVVGALDIGGCADVAGLKIGMCITHIFESPIAGLGLERVTTKLRACGTVLRISVLPQPSVSEAILHYTLASLKFSAVPSIVTRLSLQRRSSHRCLLPSF